MDAEILAPFPDVFHIQTPGYVFVTLFVGKQKALLVDTGLGLIDLKSRIRALTSLPLIVINTHGHNDHIGGNFQFDRVLLHPADIPQAHFALSSCIRHNVWRLMPPAQADAEGYWNYDLGNIQPLDPSAGFDLGGLTIQVCSLGSHTPGSIGVYCPEHSLLLTGDCLAPMVYLFFPESCDLSCYVALIDRVADMGLQWLLASHSPRLLPAAELGLYRRCATAYDPARTRPYHDPFFPQYTGRLYIHQEPGVFSEPAFLICKESEVSYEKHI